MPIVTVTLTFFVVVRLSAVVPPFISVFPAPTGPVEALDQNSRDDQICAFVADNEKVVSSRQYRLFTEVVMPVAERTVNVVAPRVIVIV